MQKIRTLLCRHYFKLRIYDKDEIDDVLGRLTFENIELKFREINQEKINAGKKVQKGKQPAINSLLKELFIEKG